MFKLWFTAIQFGAAVPELESKDVPVMVEGSQQNGKRGAICFWRVAKHVNLYSTFFLMYSFFYWRYLILFFFIVGIGCYIY